MPKKEGSDGGGRVFDIFSKRELYENDPEDRGKSDKSEQEIKDGREGNKSLPTSGISPEVADGKNGPSVAIVEDILAIEKKQPTGEMIEQGRILQMIYEEFDKVIAMAAQSRWQVNTQRAQKAIRQGETAGIRRTPEKSFKALEVLVGEYFSAIKSEFSHVDKTKVCYEDFSDYLVSELGRVDDNFSATNYIQFKVIGMILLKKYRNEVSNIIRKKLFSTV